MKIALVYDMLYPYSIGGAEYRNYLLARELSKNNEVHVFSYFFDFNKRDYKKDGIFYHGVKFFNGVYNWNGKRKALSPVTFAFSILRSFRQYKNYFDIIDISSFPYFPAYFMLSFFRRKSPKTKIITTWHEFWGDYWDFYVNSLYSYFGKKIEFSLIKKSKYNLFVSDLTLNRAIQYLKNKTLVENGNQKFDISLSQGNRHNYRNSDFHQFNAVIPNFIDYGAISQIKESSVKSDFIFVGRLMEHKNVEIIVDVIYKIKRKMPNVRCIIIGDGPMYSKIQSKIDLLGLNKNIIVLGKIINHREIYSMMKSSKVFLFPSANEGFGIAALEALACGIPVATIDFEMNAAKGVISNECGSVVDSGNLSNISDLRWAMSRYNKDYISLIDKFMRVAIHLHKNSHKYRNNCLKTAKSYDCKMVVPKIMDFYKMVHQVH